MQGRSVSNSQIAELLALEAGHAEGQLRMALKRAARRAFLWPAEAADLVAGGRSLTELAGIGPFLAKKLQGWLEKIRKLDFYGGGLAVDAAERLKGCEALLDAYAQRVFEAHDENR